MQHVSIQPLRDASETIAADLVGRGAETEWTEDELGEKLRRYINRGLKKVYDAVDKQRNRFNLDDVLSTYVETVLQSMSSALGYKKWYQNEDWGPLLTAGIEEMSPRPYWARGNQRLNHVRTIIYEQYDKQAKESDFNNILWNLVVRYVDKEQQNKAYGFLDKAFKKTVKDFTDPSMSASQRTDQEFVKSWTIDALWRIWQSGSAEVPAAMSIELCFNCIKLKLLPPVLRSSFTGAGKEAGKQCQAFLKKMVLDCYEEGNKDFSTGKDLPGIPEREVAPKSKKRKRAQSAQEYADEEIPEPEDEYDARRRDGRRRKCDEDDAQSAHRNVDAYARRRGRNSRGESAKSGRTETGARQRVVLSRNDQRRTHSLEPEEDDVSIGDEFTGGGAGEEEFVDDSEEVDDHVQDENDVMEVVDEDEDEVVDEDEDEALDEPPAKKKKIEKLECVAVQAEACTTPPGTTPVLIREKLSGWIYCELCWNALLLQQEEAGGDCEFDGEYIDTDDYEDA